MSLDFLDDEDEGQQLDRIGNRDVGFQPRTEPLEGGLPQVARPNAANGGMPAVTLRGLGAPQASSSAQGGSADARIRQAPVASPGSTDTPALGSTADLEQRVARTRVASPSAAAPSPIPTRPQPGDFQPPKMPLWEKIVVPIAAGAAAYHNPESGAKIMDEAFEQPKRDAQQRYENASGAYDKIIADEKTEADTEEAGARAEEARAAAQKDRNPPDKATKPEPVFDKAGNIIGFNTGTDLLGLNNPNLTPDMKAMVDAAKVKPATDTQTQNKENFQKVISKVDAAGLSTDPKNLDKSLDAALKAGKITTEEHQQARGYLAANPTPSTNLTVHVEGAQATNAMKEAGKTYLYNGELVKGDKVPAGADATPIKDPQAFQQEARNADIITKSFNHLINDDHRIFDDPKSRAVLATALDDHQAQQMGLLVAGTGGSISLPSGTGKIIDQLLENHAVPENLRRPLKDYIVDYWAVKDKLMMVQMQMQNGKIGRGNQAYFQAMMSQLPGPATADATMARRQLKDFSETLSGLQGQYGNLPKEKLAAVSGEVGGGGQDYGATDKPDGSTGTLPDGTKVIVKNGHIIGQ